MRHKVFVALLTLLPFITIESALHAAATPGADAEWAKTVAAAKKEGKVGVFLYHRENIETAIRVFAKAFPDIQLP